MFLQACPKTFRLGSQLEPDAVGNVIGNVIGNVTGVPKGFKNMRGSKNHAAIALTIKAIRAMPSGQYYIRAMWWHPISPMIFS